TPTPTVDGGVKAGDPTGHKYGVTSARTRTEESHFTVQVGKRTQVAHSSIDIAYYLVICDAARSTDFGCHVFRSTMSLTMVQIRTEGRIPVMGKLSRGFPIPFIPTWQVMN